LRQAERILNRTLSLAGSRTRYLAQGRNGYQGIDRYRASASYDSDSDEGRTRWELRSTLCTARTVAAATQLFAAMAEVAADAAIIDTHDTKGACP